MDRVEMLDQMSASELSQWEMLECIEPFGERAAWIRHAVSCALLANVNTPADQPRATIEDFLPQTFVTKEPAAAMDPEKVKEVMMLVMAQQNAWAAEQERLRGENR